jgi:DsbC/DsbD-like thiol-disulfide interchange protein
MEEPAMTQGRTWLPVATALAALALLLGGAGGAARAQGKKSDAVVKTDARAGKLAADGTQAVSVTLLIDRGWHVYANPAGNEDLASVQTTVAVTSKTKLEDVKVDYPAGKVVKDKDLGDYNTYENKVAIKATVRRAKGDTGPLEVTVKFQACNERMCLLPATVKVSVP